MMGFEFGLWMGRAFGREHGVLISKALMECGGDCCAMRGLNPIGPSAISPAVTEALVLADLGRGKDAGPTGGAGGGQKMIGLDGNDGPIVVGMGAATAQFAIADEGLEPVGPAVFGNDIEKGAGDVFAASADVT